MTERVSKLTLVDRTSSLQLNEDALLRRLQDFIIKHDLFDLDDDIEELIELELPRSDEIKLGMLSVFERRCFVLAAVLESTISDYVIDLQAGDAEKVTRVMRERSVPIHIAAQIIAAENKSPVSSETQAFINMCAITHSNIVSLYDWSVRARFEEWSRMLIVREGFTVYAHG